jgi:hypothetical protein
MARWLPCKRRLFIQKLKILGFIGPYSGARHEFMAITHHRLTIPSNDEYSVPQLKMMIGEIEYILEREITLEEWLRL